MTITKRTEEQLAGTGLSSQHGQGTGGNRGYIEEIVDLVNTNEAAIAANLVLIEAMDTPSEFPYTPDDATDWPGTAPDNMQDALDGLAANQPTIIGSASVDMAATGNNAVALPGAATKAFVPREAIFLVAADDTLSGDVAVSIGTSAGGAEIMAQATLTGLDGSGKSFRVDLTGLLPSIAGNASLDVTVESADSGTSGTMTAYIIGDQF